MADAFSRYALVIRTVPRTTGNVLWPVLEVAFREHGLPAAFRTDNGPPFAACKRGGLTRFAVKLIRLGITPERIAPGHPEQNARHERMHRTLKAEATKPVRLDLATQQARFDEWRKEFNEVRPHEALGQKTPATYYQPSPRLLPAELPELYRRALGDPDELARRVSGGLSPAQLRRAVRELDSTPDGWRQCALSFIEAQAWGEAFRNLDGTILESTRPPESSNGSAPAMTSISRPVSTSGVISRRWIGDALAAGIAIIAIPVVAAMRLAGSHFFQGQTTTLISVLFLGGVQLISLGILGEYVGRPYDEAKGRPLYIVREAPEDK